MANLDSIVKNVICLFQKAELIIEKASKTHKERIMVSITLFPAEVIWIIYKAYF